ncbi:MAG TPA: hypothetical protein DDW36_01725 [Candidatus Magasanikbacteria bacterium]|nr:hypothetical protein [Candidatus Magasanikbacteria bacterium]
MRSRLILISFIVLVLLTGGFVWYRDRSPEQPKVGGTIAILLVGDSNALSTTAALSSQAISPEQVDPLFLVSDDDPFLGNPNAPFRIVEFLDFQCPFSRQAFPIMRRLTARYPSEVFYQVRDFPVLSLHADALNLAKAGVCAHKQGRFWELHDRVFLEQEKASRPQIDVWAQKIGLDMNAFRSCFDSEETQKEIVSDTEVGVAAGVRGTPTFFINGRRVEGPIPEKNFEAAIQALSQQ